MNTQEENIDNTELLKSFSEKIKSNYGDNIDYTLFFDTINLKELLQIFKKLPDNHILLRNQYNIFDYKIVINIFDTYLVNIYQLLNEYIKIINTLNIKKEYFKNTKDIKDYQTTTYAVNNLKCKIKNEMIHFYEDYNNLNNIPLILQYLMKDINRFLIQYDLLILQIKLYNNNYTCILNYIYSDMPLYKYTAYCINTYTNTKLN
jgi:hypothetical protein